MAVEYAARIVKRFEGCERRLSDGRLATYIDAVGVPTIGWGSTGKDVAMGVEWTQAQADARLAHDLAELDTGVAACITVPSSDKERAALISFAYNLGIGSLRNSTLLKRLNEGNHGAAATEFMRWVRAGGKVLKGLVNRRMHEQGVFLGTLEP